MARTKEQQETLDEFIARHEEAAQADGLVVTSITFRMRRRASSRASTPGSRWPTARRPKPSTATARRTTDFLGQVTSP